MTECKHCGKYLTESTVYKNGLCATCFYLADKHSEPTNDIDLSGVNVKHCEEGERRFQWYQWGRDR